MDIVAHFSGRFNPAIYFTLTFIHSFPYEGEAIGKVTPRTYRPGGYFYDSAFLYTHAFGSGRPPV